MGTSERSASLLQKGNVMKLVVMMLAVLSASACGVGVDETYDGVTLVASTSSALEQNTETPLVAADPVVAPSVPQTPMTAVPSGPTGVKDPGTVALPQDPIPVYEGRPAGLPPPPTFNEPAPAPRR